MPLDTGSTITGVDSFLALTEDSETTASLSKLRDRAVEHTEYVVSISRQLHIFCQG